MIAEIYAQVPEVPCKGLCQAACGPTACSAVEADAMRDNGVNPPALRNHPTHGPMTCSHLTDAGRCAIYANRPLVCRLYGAVRAMRCPHGCKPSRGFLDEVKARDLLAELRTASNGRPNHVSIEEG